MSVRYFVFYCFIFFLFRYGLLNEYVFIDFDMNSAGWVWVGNIYVQ